MNKKINLDHIFLHATFQLIAGVVYGFSVYLLMARGYDSTQAGTCMSLASILNLCIAPVLSDILDKSKDIKTYKTISLLSIVIVALFTVNYFLTEKSLLLSVVFVLAMGLYGTLEPLINALSSKLENRGFQIEFSSARAIGSLSYGVCCAGLGYVSEIFDYKVVLLFAIGFCLAMFITALCINRDIQNSNTEAVIINQENVSFKDYIKNNKIFMALCFCLTGIFLGYTCVDNFTLLVVENIGGSSKDMGMVLGFKALLEGIAMFLFPVFKKKIKLENILILSAFGFMLRIGFIYLAQNVFMMYLDQFFQMISFSLIFPGMVEYITVNMSKKEAIRGNAFFALTIGISSIFSSFLGGYIADNYSVKAMEMFAFIISTIFALGFIVILLYKKNKDRQKQCIRTL